jgi:hypothetical protein
MMVSLLRHATLSPRHLPFSLRRHATPLSLPIIAYFLFSPPLPLPHIISCHYFAFFDIFADYCHLPPFSPFFAFRR